MKKIKEFPCTECGKDATVGLSNFKADKVIIKKNERLCLSCAGKRGVKFFQ